MDEFSIHSLLNPHRKINPVIRILSVPLTLLIVVVFCDGVHDLVFEIRTPESILMSFLNTLLMAYFIWPLSYVAIKGRAPPAWHPYQ